MIIDGEDFIDWLHNLPEDARKRFKPDFTDQDIDVCAFSAELLVIMYHNSLLERPDIGGHGRLRKVRHLHMVVNNKGSD